jgi:transposase
VEKQARLEPEEIPDAEHELIIERVAAIDVAKASGKVCVRASKDAAGRRSSRVWDVAATTGAITELAAQLVVDRIDRVTVESTSDYWRIWYYLLESAGLSVQLVNARDVKNVPGRSKTDLLTELSRDLEEGCVRRRVRPVRFAARDQRWGCASGVGWAGGVAAGLSRGDGRSVPAVSAR